MSKFYGTLSGSAKTQATRRGNRNTGVTVQAASWAGGIEVRVFEDEQGNECFSVSHIPWYGHGAYKLIKQGKLGKVRVPRHA